MLLADIDLERSPKMRDELDQEAIALYAQSLDALPAIELVRIADGSLVIADGWHRYRAAEAAGASEIQAAIRDGSARDALMAALAANARHGVRRSRADLRVVVRAALRELGALSDRQLGPIIGVSDKTVAGRAGLVASAGGRGEPRRGKDGKTRSSLSRASPGLRAAGRRASGRRGSERGSARRRWSSRWRPPTRAG
ncbi:MAG: ParB N-terminal domain-containing protein [Myxococcales bacterium]|nr:ParB N-terminal domain-containing protein [Myxococcales bacterium]